MMTILLRVFAWCLAAAVAFATLGPPGYRPHSNLGQDGEHALAFVLWGSPSASLIPATGC
jgi:hypothetical protein